jgi:hypothetical protein
MSTGNKHHERPRILLSRFQLTCPQALASKGVRYGRARIAPSGQPPAGNFTFYETFSQFLRL